MSTDLENLLIIGCIGLHVCTFISFTVQNIELSAIAVHDVTNVKLSARPLLHVGGIQGVQLKALYQ